MHALQLGFVAATFLVPFGCWMVLRILRARQPARVAAAFEHGVSWVLSVTLVAAYLLALILKWRGEGLSTDATLPMHLCDWAAVAILIALIGRGQASFDVAYCWGLAGTFQALLTPAIEINDGARVWCFMIVHSVIPASVLWLLLGPGMRPSSRSWRRVAGWSTLYLATALLANHWAGANYGFLARRPDKASLLDHFPDPAGGWLYVLSIHAFALGLFAVMLAPWRMARHAKHGEASSR